MVNKKEKSNNKPDKTSKSDERNGLVKSKNSNKSFAFLFILIIATWAFIGYHFLYGKPKLNTGENTTNQNILNNSEEIRKLKNSLTLLEEEMQLLNRKFGEELKEKQPAENEVSLDESSKKETSPKIEKDVNISPENDDIKQQNVEIQNKKIDNASNQNVQTSENKENASSLEKKPESEIPNENQVVLFDIELANQQFEEIINTQENINSDISQFSSRTTELESSLNEVVKQMGEAKLKERSVNLIVAAINLHKAVQESRNHKIELDILESLSQHEGDSGLDHNIKIIKESPNSKTTSFEEIKKQFEQITKNIINKEKHSIKDPSFTDNILMKLSEIVSIRKIEANKDSKKAEDVFARAYKYLSEKNLNSAINELNQIEDLSGEQQTELQTWNETAKSHLNSKKAAQNILNYAIQPKTLEKDETQHLNNN